MKMTKLSKTLLVAGIALTVGATPFVGSVSASAQTVLADNRYETIISFSTEDLSEATGVQLTSASVNKVYKSLKKAKTWEKLGYTSEAKRIANYFSQYKKEVVAILTDMAKDENVLVTITTSNQDYRVYVGTIGVGEELPPYLDDALNN